LNLENKKENSSRNTIGKHAKHVSNLEKLSFADTNPTKMANTFNNFSNIQIQNNLRY